MVENHQLVQLFVLILYVKIGFFFLYELTYQE